MPQIAYVSTYVPKKCGLATYTHHLREAVNLAKGNRSQDPVIAICNDEERLDYREPWMWPLIKPDIEEYRRQAETVNQSSVDIVSLQHEFGIFGGDAGNYALEFLKRVNKPVVTTFHTVFEQPMEPYASVQKEIAEWSDHLLVMNRKAIGYLHESFGIPLEKISFIPHGTPLPSNGRQATRRAHGWENRKVLFTFGLLGRSKGIEFALRAMAGAVQAVPDLLYVIAGATHPEVRKNEGEAYRDELTALIEEIGLTHHVQMINRYIPEDELAALISAADLYITPYPGMQQITSGTLAYAAGLGRPILSTPYCYARDLVQGHEDMLLPYGDVEAWSAKIIELFSYPGMLGRWERIITDIGRSMHWPQVGAQHLRLFGQIVSDQRATIADVG
ncbi:glycosyltransferase family 4 protein [Cohnella candidum]|uniref:Glycosyltransferase n=1 Tax=Cohnella candidum TaxID=2674991 RepID=A0A3G3K4D9_9BACL|nr:glycosyltransferase family 4 protein [Cohnella candidum]AYQ75405.1 glycosyltransferase [Cohnella candidum]